MRKSKFTDEQIAFALKQAELGTSVEEVCRKMGISETTLYVWRKKYAGVGPSELRRLRQLEEENRKPKQIVADLSLDKAMLRTSSQESFEAFAAPRLGVRVDAVFRLQPALCVAPCEDIGVDLLLQACQEGRVGAEDAHQGDHPDARALRIPPGARTAAPRRPQGQREAGLSPVQGGRTVAAAQAASAQQGSLAASTEATGAHLGL
ncbi:MAG: transposase [Burkholderiales bacterium]|nr:transposase [Burkholderiales bacterium]